MTKKENTGFFRNKTTIARTNVPVVIDEEKFNQIVDNAPTNMPPHTEKKNSPEGIKNNSEDSNTNPTAMTPSMEAGEIPTSEPEQAKEDKKPESALTKKSAALKKKNDKAIARVPKSVLFEADLYEDMMKLAHIERKNGNQFINDVMKKYIEEHKGLIMRYDRLLKI